MANLVFQHFKGILSCIAFGMVVVFCATLIKAAKELDILLIQLGSRIFTILGILPFLVYKHHSLLPPVEDRLLVYACGITHAFSSYMDSVCYRNLPMAIATTLIASQQATTTILGRIILKEKLDGYKITGLILSMMGIIVTYKLHELPIYGGNYIFSSRKGILGFVAGVAGTISRSVFLILLRKAKANNPIATAFHMGVSAAVLLTVFYGSLGSSWHLYCNWEPFVLLVLAIAGPLVLALRAVTTHLEDVAIVTVVTTSSQLILSLFVQMLIFHNNPDVFAISGSILLILSILSISLGRWIQSHPNSLKLH